MNKLNKLYNSISDNELNNQKTTMSLINEHMIMFNNGSLNMGNQSILTILGAKNGQGIKPIIKGIEQLSIISGHRKAIVNKLLLPIADFSNLVESENTTKPKKTKVEKKKTKEENKQIVEIDYAEKKSNEAIRKNIVRTTANNIVIPILFLASQDKSNYSFNDNKVKIIFEPGRSIIGDTGILVSKIIYIKDSGSKKFIILDAAMNDLMRPALYGAFHKTLPVTKSNKTSKKPY